VYLIDEVHMLSTHSFNALRKTLEEPPPHVKFLLATTDPQKLPVTVLSRCLQFNLMRLPVDLIDAQLEKILGAEDIAFDKLALSLLARSADGSMRDGLSLMDQAIAYGGGEVRETDVREMLGTIDRDLIWRCLQHLAAGDAAALIAVVDDVANRGMDYASVLEELLVALHNVAMAQVDEALIASLADDEQEQIKSIAQSLSPEDTQLFYQTGLVSRRDLPLAPDPRSGLEMSLLRMLAFKPVAPGQVAITKSNDKVATESGGGSTASGKITKKASTPATSKIADEPVVASSPEAKLPQPELLEAGEWSEAVNQLGLSGINQQLANNTVRESFANGKLALVLDESFANLHSREREQTLSDALTKLYGKEIKLELRIGKPIEETPAQAQSRQNSELQQAAVEAIDNDPNVAALQEQFGARVDPGSIRPKAEAGGK
jgi:DNA polymerase-3 subunit gamma/tau